MREDIQIEKLVTGTETRSFISQQQHIDCTVTKNHFLSKPCNLQVSILLTLNKCPFTNFNCRKT